MSSSTERYLTIAIVVLAALVRLVFAVVTPAWQSPDEYPHYWVAQEIAKTGSLPKSVPVSPAYESFQPPLYYAAGSLLLHGTAMLPFADNPVAPPQPLVFLRLLSVVAGVLTIVISARMLGRIPGLDGWERTGALAVLALLPTFVGVTSSVNNDSLVTLFAAIALLFAFEPRWEPVTAVRVGLWGGLAFLTKVSAVILFPLLLVRAYQVSERKWKLTLRSAGLMAAGWIPGVALLIFRNVSQYGDPFSINPGLPRGFALSVEQVVHALRNLGWSFWLSFGRSYQLTPPAWVYVATVVPLMLIAFWGWRKSWKDTGWFLFAAVFGLASALVISLTYTLSYPAGTQTSWGKNLYPLLPVIVPALVLGWRRAFPAAGVPILVLTAMLLGAGCLWALSQLALMV